MHQQQAIAYNFNPDLQKAIDLRSIFDLMDIQGKTSYDDIAEAEINIEIYVMGHSKIDPSIVKVFQGTPLEQIYRDQVIERVKDIALSNELDCCPNCQADNGLPCPTHDC